MTAERWRPVVGFEGLYEVSDWGRVKSLERPARVCGEGTRIVRGRILKPKKLGRCGYPAVKLYNGTQKSYDVHRLVLIAFVGPAPPGTECCHWDGDPTNNRLSNLRWDTHKNNKADQLRHGTDNRGERHSMAKLTTPEVVQIKILLKYSDLSQAEIGRMFGVSPQVIYAINTGRSWAWLKAPTSEKELKKWLNQQ